MYSYHSCEISMPLVKKSITVTDWHEQWIRKQVDYAENGNDSKYFRDLIRRDWERSSQFRVLRQAMQEGLERVVSATRPSRISGRRPSGATERAVVDVGLSRTKWGRTAVAIDHAEDVHEANVSLPVVQMLPVVSACHA